MVRNRSTVFPVIHQAARTVLPLCPPRPVLSPRPVILSACGPGGRRIVQVLGDDALPVLTVPQLSDRDSLSAAIGRAIQHPGAARHTQDAHQVRLAIVGPADEILDSWQRCQSGLPATADVPLAVIALQTDQRPVDPLPEGCRAWFQFTRHYADGDLTEEQLIELLRRLIQAGALTPLFRFADRQHPRSLVLVTAALGWLPEVSLHEALASYLGWQLARTIADHAGPERRVRPLFSVAALRALETQLRLQMERETVAALLRFRPTAPEPAPDFDVASPDRPAEMRRLADRWCDVQWQTVLSDLSRRWRSPTDTGSVWASIQDARRRLSELAHVADEQRRHAARRQLESARRGQAREIGRLQAMRRRLAILCGLRWWRSVLSRRALLDYLDARAEQWVAGYCHDALRQLESRFGDLEAQLRQFRDTTGNRQRELQELFQPDHPCLLPLQDADSLIGLVRQQMLRLGDACRIAGHERTWQLAGNRVLCALADSQSPWPPVTQAAGEVARMMPAGNRPLAALCRGLPPSYSPSRLQQALSRAALPRTYPQPSQPALDTEVFFQATPPCHAEDTSPLPALLHLRWASSREDTMNDRRIL